MVATSNYDEIKIYLHYVMTIILSMNKEIRLQRFVIVVDSSMVVFTFEYLMH